MVTNFLVGKRKPQQDAVKKSESRVAHKLTKTKTPIETSVATGNTSSDDSTHQNKKSSQRKDNNYCKSIWSQIITNNDLENTSTTELITNLRKGIPPEL